jgi:hypothetical protein
MSHSYQLKSAKSLDSRLRGNDLVRHFFQEPLYMRGRKLEARSQWFAFIIVMVFALIAVFTIFEGFAWVGATILGADLVALISVFLLKNKQENNLSATQTEGQEEE